VDLTKAIYEDLGNYICAYTDGELERELKEVPCIKYYAEYKRLDDPAHFGISSLEKGSMSLVGQKWMGGQGTRNPHSDITAHIINRKY
jgi:hypothetical protein